MSDEKTIEELQSRLTHIINGTCNAIGCEGCGLKWPIKTCEATGRAIETDCSANQLQDQIYTLKFEEVEP